MSAVFTSEAGRQLLHERYRELLGSWPVPHEDLRVPTREGETFVVASGPPDAPAVALLHGSTTNSAMWMGDVATWARDLRVYAVDVIGEPGRVERLALLSPGGIGRQKWARLARTAPHATVHLLPGVGHFPAAQAAPIHEFLRPTPVER